MNLEGKRVLVTGGAGFIGSHTVDALIRQGAEVQIVDDLSTGTEININPKAFISRLDLRDPRVAKSAFDLFKPEIVYHFAFDANAIASSVDPPMMLDNIKLSLNVLQACREVDVDRIVFASSGYVYGGMNAVSNEDSETFPISPYAIAKKTVEDFFKYYAYAFGIKTTILRYPVVYGPRQSYGAMTAYIKELSNGEETFFWGDGSKVRDYVYIEDIVEANLRVLNLEDEYRMLVLNTGSGKPTTLKEMYLMLAALLKATPRLSYLENRSGELDRCVLDSALIEEKLNWFPKINLEEGLRRRIENEEM